MPPQFDLTDQPFNTSFAPLCALGQALWSAASWIACAPSALFRKSRASTPRARSYWTLFW